MLVLVKMVATTPFGNHVNAQTQIWTGFLKQHAANQCEISPSKLIVYKLNAYHNKYLTSLNVCVCVLGRERERERVRERERERDKESERKRVTTRPRKKMQVAKASGDTQTK